MPLWIGPADSLAQLGWALLLNVCLAFSAFRRRSLTRSGAVAATLVGGGVLLGGGLCLWLLLGAFFISSSLLGRVGRDSKARLVVQPAKGNRRDHVQVLANGGLALLLAIGYGLYATPALLLAYATALAAATADTWASEIGVLSRRAPVSILTWRPLEPGSSGGVSRLGFAVSAGGALFIALGFTLGAGLAFPWPLVTLLGMASLITVGGFLGSVIDSLLGATLQARYREPNGRLTEQCNHNGNSLPLAQGMRWIDNDVVNALSGLIATATAALPWWLFSLNMEG